MRVLLFLPLALAFACLALLSLLAFLGVMILARTLQVIAAARSIWDRGRKSERQLMTTDYRYSGQSGVCDAKANTGARE
jgi:hypothetical protein